MESDHVREPWNKGKLVGHKRPLKLKDIWAIRITFSETSAFESWRYSISPSTASFAAATW